MRPSPPRARRCACAVAAMGILGCATGSASGKGVVTLTSDPGPECRALGAVSGVNPFGSAMVTREDQVQWAQGDARDQAARLGATHIRFRPADPANPDRAVGIAYDCGRPQPAQPAAAIGCTKDLDCKGERICEAGRCVEPGLPDAVQ